VSDIIIEEIKDCGSEAKFLHRMTNDVCDTETNAFGVEKSGELSNFSNDTGK
jgi:hypothetical protein